MRITFPRLGRSHPKSPPEATSTRFGEVQFPLKDPLTPEEEQRFGIDGESWVTLEGLGSRLSISRERVRQIEQQALERLKRDSFLREAFEDLLSDPCRSLSRAV